MTPAQHIPFQLGQRISHGAFANIYLGRDRQSAEIYAIKVIDKRGIIKSGRQTLKQIDGEVKLHKLCGKHDHIIEFFSADETPSGHVWICMEFASGGDLFDKIEPDLGLPEDIALLYFKQMIAGLTYIHSQGVSHRDVKPENILLDADGRLKVADFGLAALYQYQGKKRSLSTCCGSPPYAAPEILSTYDGEKVDVWSSAIVLFALCLGSTPWNEPTCQDELFKEFVESGVPQCEPWTRLSSDVLDLLKKMLSIDAGRRYTFAQVSQHPWMTRRTPEVDGITLANTLMSRMQVDLPSSSQHVQDIDDPAFSQFTAGSQVLESLTQRARRFADVTGSERLTRAFSVYPKHEIEELLRSVLPGLRVSYDAGIIQTLDSTGCVLLGSIGVFPYRDGLNVIEFVKRKGDPTHWRRLFKTVMYSIKQVIYTN